MSYYDAPNIPFGLPGKFNANDFLNPPKDTFTSTGLDNRYLKKISNDTTPFNLTCNKLTSSDLQSNLLTITGNSTFLSNVNVASTGTLNNLNVSTLSTLNNLIVSGTSTINNININGNTTITSNLQISGLTHIFNDVIMNDKSLLLRNSSDHYIRMAGGGASTFSNIDVDGPVIAGNGVCLGTGIGQGTDKAYLLIKNNNMSIMSDLNISGNTNFNKDVIIGGNLTVNGTQVIMNTETVNIEDNIVLLNSNFTTGTPLSSFQSGLEVRRGSQLPYRFVFSENDDSFKIGVFNTSVSDLQSVATRENVPISSSIPYWNSSASRFDTSNNMISDIQNNRIIISSLQVSNTTSLLSSLLVSGLVSLVNGLNVSGTTNLLSSTTIRSSLNVSGLATLVNGLNVSGSTNLLSPTTISSTLNVLGDTTFNNSSTFNLNNNTMTINTNTSNSLLITGLDDNGNGRIFEPPLKIQGVNYGIGLNYSTFNEGPNYLRSGIQIKSKAQTQWTTIMDTNVWDGRGSNIRFYTYDQSQSANTRLGMVNRLEITNNTTATSLTNGTVNINGSLGVSDDIYCSSFVSLSASSCMSNFLVSGLSYFGGTLACSGRALLRSACSVSTTFNVSGATLLTSTLDVSGISNFNNIVNINNPTSINSSLFINNGLTLSGNATINSSLFVSNASTFNNSLTVNNGLNVSNNSNFRSNVYLNDRPLYIRSDNNHGLRMCGGGIGGAPTFAGIDIDGPVLFGVSGGILGTTTGGEKSLLQWNVNNGVSINSNLNVSGISTIQNLNVNNGINVSNTSNFRGDVYMNDKALYLRSDINHGLRFKSEVDGPGLYGFSGGILGTTAGTDRTILQWHNTNGVSINSNLNISGTTTFNSVLNVNNINFTQENALTSTTTNLRYFEQDPNYQLVFSLINPANISTTPGPGYAIKMGNSSSGIIFYCGSCNYTKLNTNENLNQVVINITGFLKTPSVSGGRYSCTLGTLSGFPLNVCANVDGADFYAKFYRLQATAAPVNLTWGNMANSGYVQISGWYRY